MTPTSHTESFIIQTTDCISTLDTTLPDLLGTYILVQWMEITAAKLINTVLNTDERLTVGEHVDIHHAGMARLGETVTITATLTGHDKKHARFTIEAYNGNKRIATAEHTRTIIPRKLLERMMHGHTKS